MTDIDIDAIRQRVNRATGGTWTLRERQSPDRRVLAVISEGEGEMTYADIAEVPLEPGDEINDWRNDAEFIAHARTDVPALLAKVDELTAERDEYATDNTRVVAQLVAANHHADGLKADLRSANTANTAYANENARLRSELAEADVVIGSMRAAIDEADEAATR